MTQSIKQCILTCRIRLLILKEWILSLRDLLSFRVPGAKIYFMFTHEIIIVIAIIKFLYVPDIALNIVHALTHHICTMQPTWEDTVFVHIL